MKPDLFEAPDYYNLDDLFSEEDEYTLFLHAANYFGDPDDEYELSREEEELFDSGYEDLVDNQLPVAV